MTSAVSSVVSNVVFAEKFTIDDRLPFVTVDMPNSMGKFGILAPSIMWYGQLIFLLLIQMVFSVFFAGIIFNLIIRKINTPASYLAGFGIIIPLACYVPFWFLHEFDLRSKVMRMALIILPINVIFKSLEAMFGFAPTINQKTLYNYCMYSASLLDTEFDPATQQPKRASVREALALISDYFLHFLLITILFSVTRPFSFAPFDASVDAYSFDHTIWDLFYVEHLLNNFLGAALLSVCLSFSTIGTATLFCLLTRGKVFRVVKNPMFTSNSPSDFWGRRWNNFVHVILKRGVYKPVRIYSTKGAAVLATFFASGIIHEYVLTILFYVHHNEKDSSGDCTNCYIPLRGKNLAFFTWNGTIIIFETMLNDTWVIKWMAGKLPKPIISLLVVLTALPVGHWLTGDLIHGGYFHHFALGFPLIVRLS